MKEFALKKDARNILQTYRNTVLIIDVYIKKMIHIKYAIGKEKMDKDIVVIIQG